MHVNISEKKGLLKEKVIPNNAQNIVMFRKKKSTNCISYTVKALHNKTESVPKITCFHYQWLELSYFPYNFNFFVIMPYFS